MTYSIQTGWNGKVPEISKTEIIAPNQHTARAIIKYLGIGFVHLSWVEEEISAKGMNLSRFGDNSHKETHWMGIYNLIKN